MPTDLSGGFPPAEAQAQMTQEIFRVMLEPANLCKYGCTAIFIWAILGGVRLVPKRPFVSFGRLILLFLFIELLQLGLSFLAMQNRAFAGIGTWFSALGGVAFYAVLFCPFDTRAAIVTSTVAYTTATIVIELGAVAGRWIGFLVPGFDSAITGYTANVLLLIMVLLIGQHPARKYYVSIHSVRMNLIACIGSTGVAVLYDFYAVHYFEWGGDVYVTSFITIALFLLYFINLSIYLLTYYLSREHAHVLELTANQQINKSAENLMALTEANLEEYHKINHDLQNQYAYMRALLQKQDYEGLDRYFEELTGTFASSLAPVVDCGNHALNVIFNMELAKANQAGVLLDVKATPPHELPFRELELCKLYTNVIDNAIEACVRERVDDPVVKVLVTVNGDYLFSRVSNPTKIAPSTLERALRTSKADKRLHGKGRTIVRDIVRAYGGRVGERIEDGTYLTEFMLDLRTKEVPANGK